jgi:hypothetical protein
MAKREPRAASPTTTTATESAIEGFAEDLGRLLGSARGRADQWLKQRQTIAKNLEQIRDTASTLLTQLGNRAEGLRGRKKKDQPEFAPAPISRKKRRKLSAKARRAISEAQKARWARQRRETKDE